MAPCDIEHRLIEQQRVFDAIADEGVDLEPLIVGDQHFLALIVERQDALVDINHAINEGRACVKTGIVDEVAHRLAEAQHQRLLGRIDGEQRERREDDHDDDRDEREQGDRAAHFGAPAGLPVCGSMAM